MLGAQRNVALCLGVFLIIHVVHGISAFDDNFLNSPFQVDGNLDGDRTVNNARGVVQQVPQFSNERQGSWRAEKELSRHEYGKTLSSLRRRQMLENRTIKTVR